MVGINKFMAGWKSGLGGSISPDFIFDKNLSWLTKGHLLLIS